MSITTRKRIDISDETHVLLEAEARRRNVPIRDLVEQAAREMLDRRAQAEISVRHQREQRHLNRAEEQTAQIGDLARRVGALIERQAKDLPVALRDGFDAIRATIRETGGTGHLRDMLRHFEARYVERLDTFNGELTTTLDGLSRAVTREASGVTAQIRDLRHWHASRRMTAIASAVGAVALFVLMSLLLADTPPTRWYAIRLTGNNKSLLAAWTLAGDGRATGALMAETRGLLENATFRDNYGGCIERAKRASGPLPCRLTIPRIKVVEP